MCNPSKPLDPSAQHLAVLQQAFDSLGNGSQGGNTATIVVQGGDQIIVHSTMYKIYRCQDLHQF